MRKRFLSLLVLTVLVVYMLGAGSALASDVADWELDASPITLSIYVNVPENPDGEFDTYWGKNPVTQKITEDTGVTPEVLYSPDATGQRLNLLIATDDLPDIIIYPTAEQEAELIRNDMVWDLFELADLYAPQLKEKIPQNVVLYTRLNLGMYEMYKFLATYARPELIEKLGLAKNPAGATFVKQVYEELGSPVIETAEDYYQLVKAAAAKYPDMFVQSSRYGIDMLDKYGSPRIVTTLLPMAGMYYYFKDNESTVRYFYEDEGFLPLLQFANKLYNEKLIFQDEFVADTTARRGNLVAGTIMGELNQDYDNLVVHSAELESGYAGQEYGFDQYTMLDAFRITDRDPLFEAQLYTGYGSFMISKTSENPERAIRFLEYMLYDEDIQKMLMFGIEGTHYDMVDGQPVLRDEYVEAYRKDFLKCRAETGIHYLYRFRNSEWQPLFYEQIYGTPDYVADALKKTNLYAKDVSEFINIDTFPTGSEEAKIFAIIKDYYSAEVVSIIAGDPENVEASYNAMIEKMYGLGLEKLNNYLTQSYLDRQVKVVEYSN